VIEIASATYATPLELVRFINIEGTVPDRNATGTARPKENLGTGSSSTVLFYLDQAYIVAGSYTLYSGASEGAATALTEDTHYTLEKDNGTVTLTAAGTAQVTTNNVYGAYSYNILKLTNAQLQSALDYAEGEINKETGIKWYNGGAASPRFGSAVNESHDGKGKFNRDYYLLKYPLPDISTQLTAGMAANAGTATVDSTNGFPATGYIGIGSNKLKYSGKTSTTFTGLTGTATAHGTATNVYPFVVEISTTSSGTVPTWTILTKDSQFDLDLDTGRVHLYRTEYDLVYYALQYPPVGIPNRFRATYLHGYKTIPDEIKRLCLMIAAKHLVHLGYRRAIVNGVSVEVQFPEIDEAWIKETIIKYKSYRNSNV
jgi:hypothetical protein